MIWNSFLRIFLCATLMFQSVAAFETDQYNLPSEPLADIGDEVAEYVQENLQKAADKLNAKISVARKCLENKEKNCQNNKKESEKLAEYESDEALAKEVYKLLGAGIIPFTKSGTWMNSHRFKSQPARYTTSFGDSIYKLAPTNYLTISPTVKIYNAQFGTDKIAHIFQQGFSYYTKYKRGLRENLSENEAVKKAVNWGKFSEKTYFGTMVSGVYSNGDLASNYAGMKFYLNLTNQIKIGNNLVNPMFVKENGFWKFVGDKDFLKPFVGNHFNEALNPSKYVVGLRSIVRQTVREKSCPLWRKNFPDLRREDFQNLTESLKLWHGEDYGFIGNKKNITIADTCFTN